MQISPIAQVALLQTEMNSGLRFVPRIGMNSATGGKKTNLSFYVQSIKNGNVVYALFLCL